jgi:cbb3-type cytochrome oxidase maturation protein
MEVIWFMIPVSIGLGLFFVICFVRASKNDQFDDLETPAYRMLLEDEVISTKRNEE